MCALIRNEHLPNADLLSEQKKKHYILVSLFYYTTDIYRIAEVFSHVLYDDVIGAHTGTRASFTPRVAPATSSITR